MLLHIRIDPAWYGSEQRCQTVRPLQQGQFRMQTYTIFGSDFGANQQRQLTERPREMLAFETPQRGLALVLRRPVEITALSCPSGLYQPSGRYRADIKNAGNA
jgi:hypothetical protein